MTRACWLALLTLAPLIAAGGCVDSPAAPLADESEGVASDRVRETTFDDIKFEMESNDEFVDSMITPEIAALNDSRIRIRGYMFPTYRERGLKQFVLVRDNLECCFGPGAALYDCVLVYMRDGVTAEYSRTPIAVQGEFRFEKLSAGPDGPLLAIYRLDDAVVE